MDQKLEYGVLTIATQMAISSTAVKNYVKECKSLQIRPRTKKKRLFKQIEGRVVSVLVKGPLLYCPEIETSIYQCCLGGEKSTGSTVEKSKSKSKTMLQSCISTIKSLVLGM